MTPHRLAAAAALVVSLATRAAAVDPAPGAPRPSSAPPPARIVSLAPSVTETLFALGVGARLVAVSDHCDYPPEAAALPRVGTFNAPSVEAVIAARPDVVIGLPSPGNHENVLTMERLGVRVELVDPERLADLPAVTRRIAAVAGVPEAGERLVAAMQRDMDAVRRKIAGAPTPRTLMLVGREPLIAVGPESFLGEMLVAAGAVNVAPAQGAWPRLNLEVVIAADPEVIVDCSMGTEASTAALAFWERFPSLAAVRNGRVHPFRSFEALRPGPRLALALAELARVLHPDRF
ncbi:MAG: ABC transporter substrate-binding protein [Deltaproteobacteria bacterium]|nr:ABC transporter substrate-binding protein [Deltaproteobacteria bacterium]